MKYNLLLPFILLIHLALSAQDYSTPNTGIKWNLDSLLQNNPEFITFEDDNFILNTNLDVLENDTVFLEPGDRLRVEPNVEITISGSFYSEGNAQDSIFIEGTMADSNFEGFRFEESSSVRIDHSVIQYSGGLKVLTTNFELTNSNISHNTIGSATGGTVSLSRGSAMIANNRFMNNQLPAVSSGANQEVSAQIFSNYIKGNGQSNDNRPQLNIGPTGPDTLRIMNNSIIGDRSLDMVGGIAVSNFIAGEVHALISNNNIVDNRYGITIVGGNAHAKIEGNVIEDNNTQGQPNVGGSGISLSSSEDSQTIMISNNAIRGNLWGVTLINEASANLGDGDNNSGNNVFSENQNSDNIYALYNNTNNAISAENNCWIEGQTNTIEDAESVIVHSVDNSSLGTVDFDPVNCSNNLDNIHFEKPQISLYPNPVKDHLHFSSTQMIESLEIFTLTGQKLSTQNINDFDAKISISLSTGIYFVHFYSTTGGETTDKLIVK